MEETGIERHWREEREAEERRRFELLRNITPQQAAQLNGQIGGLYGSALDSRPLSVGGSVLGGIFGF